MTFTCQRCGYNWTNEKVRQELTTTHPSYMGQPIIRSLETQGDGKLYGWQCKKCENFHECKALKPYWKKDEK